MTTPKFEHSEIEKMLENFKSKDWDFMLQSQKKLYAHSPEIISQLLGEVKALKESVKWHKGYAEMLKQGEDQQIQILKEAMEKIIEYTSFKDKDFGQCMTTSGALAQEALAKLNQVKGEGE